MQLNLLDVLSLCLCPLAPIGQAVHQLLLIQAFRPDRLLAMSSIFVAKVLGENFMVIIEQPLDLANIVDSEVETGMKDCLTLKMIVFKLFIVSPYSILLNICKPS